MSLDIFSLTTLWSRSKQIDGKVGEIECIDINNDSTSSSNSFSTRIHDLYIGTIDGIIHKFSLQKNSINSEYECQLISSVNIGNRKPVIKIKAITLSLHRIIILSDNILQILNSYNLQFISNIKLKNILTFAVLNKSTHGGSIDICISTKRNKLQLYSLDRTNINLKYEISVPEPIISIGMDECGILACSETHYYGFISITNNDRRIQTIYSLYDHTVPTCFTAIRPGEYILNGPRIGIPGTLEGTSERATISFDDQPNNFIYSHPYLFTLNRDYIRIYSYLDDKLKQEIPLKNCYNLIDIPQENKNLILTHNKDHIYLLESLTIEKQIDQLLNIFRLKDALILAESNCLSIEKRPTDPLILSTKKRIGLIEFRGMNVFRALELFDDVHLDFHEIILEIPNFLPLNSPWIDIDRSQYIQWLQAFSDYMIKRSTEFSRQPDYYSSLLKAYLIIKSRDKIIEYLEENASFIPLEFHDLLFKSHFYHGTAILYSAHDKHEQTIDIWKKIVLNEYPNDDTFPGIWIIGKYILERNTDRTLEFSVAKWLLEQNEEELAIKIFINKYQNELHDDPFCSDRVINLLRSYPTALRNYLEQAVFKLMIETDEIHTMLVTIYLDQILSKSPDEQIRSKLQEFLIKSNSYRVQSVLSRISQTDKFKREIAILHGKMNNFEQAFGILVDELEDYEYAVNYCQNLSYGKSDDDRKIVAHVLFKVFLTSLNKHPDEITAVLLRLLRNNEIHFDFLEVLKRLPSHWSITSVAEILIRAVRTCSYIRRSAGLELSLSRLQNEKLNIKLVQLKRGSVMITEYRRCKHCLQQFYETSCVVYQDGSQVHVHCAKQLNRE